MSLIPLILRLLLVVGVFVWDAVKKLWPYLGGIAAGFGLYSALTSNWEALVASINAVSGMVVGMPAYDEIAQVNRLFPLTELLAMFAVIFGIRLAAMAFRAVHAFFKGG